MFLLLAACSVVQTPCQALYTEICDVCPIGNDDFTRTQCTCLEEGTLTPGDFPEGWEISADEAAYECDSLRYQLEWPGDDDAGYCRAELKLLRDYPDLACENLGYGDDTETFDTGYSY